MDQIDSLLSIGHYKKKPSGFFISLLWAKFVGGARQYCKRYVWTDNIRLACKHKTLLIINDPEFGILLVLLYISPHKTAKKPLTHIRNITNY